MRRPALDVLVVVAPEDVERLRRRDHLLRLGDRVGRRQRNREAKILLDLTGDFGRRELDAQRDHPQRAGERAGLRRRGGSRPCEPPETCHSDCADAATLEQLATRHAVAVFCRCRLRRGVRKLPGELVYVELVVLTHVLSSPFASPPRLENHSPQDTVAVSRPRIRVYNPRLRRSTDLRAVRITPFLRAREPLGPYAG